MSFLFQGLGTFTWRSDRRAARRLYAFALAEHGSMLDLRLAANACGDAERAALYLKHADDESRHAQMFYKHSVEWHRRSGLVTPVAPRADIEQLFVRLGEARFLAFVHRGEGRGRRQFEAYRAHFARRGETKTAQLFETILTDEREHERYTGEQLALVVGSARAARREVFRARVWEGWRTYRRVGRVVAGSLYSATMAVLYVLSMPLALLLRVVGASASSGRWLPPEG